MLMESNVLQLHQTSNQLDRHPAPFGFSPQMASFVSIETGLLGLVVVVVDDSG